MDFNRHCGHHSARLYYHEQVATKFCFQGIHRILDLFSNCINHPYHRTFNLDWRHTKISL